MPADPLALKRYNSITLSGNRLVHSFDYGTDDTAAEVVTAGYFNTCRMTLTKGSKIFATVDVDGTTDLITLLVTAVPASGNVTVAYNNDAAGT